jgi:predicted metal-dependent hydrolase
MNNTQKLIIAQRELIKTLTSELILPEPTTFSKEAEYNVLMKKEGKLRKKIAKLEQKIVNKETIKTK